MVMSRGCATNSTSPLPSRYAFTLARVASGMKLPFSSVVPTFAVRTASAKAASALERSPFGAVTAARAHIGGLAPDALRDPQALQRYQAAQEQLSSAISRLVAVAEAYPQLRANENFLALQAQLEGTENRIAVERRRYNDSVQRYNTLVRSFPTMLMARATGFQTREAFKATTAGADKAPEVKF